MNFSLNYLLIFLAFFIFNSCSGFGKIHSDKKQWYKGNLHSHSFWSDGDDFPEMIMHWYKSNDYDFAVLSDHNTLHEGEKWIPVVNSSTRQQVFENYVNTVGEDKVEIRHDSNGRTEVRLRTLEEYRDEFEEDSEFLIIQSEELTSSFDSKPLHMNVTNIQEYIEPKTGTSIADQIQKNIDAVAKQRKETGQPMFLHVNHPNFGWAITPEDLMKLEGERFFEVYNGHPLVNNYGDENRPGMEAIWDLVLASYLTDNKELLYGLAVDDAHHYHVFDETRSNPGRGWVMVQANQLTPEAIIDAMERGDFYASSGVELKTVTCMKNKYTIEVEPETGVEYTIQFYGTKKNKGDSVGQLLSQTTGLKASYQIREDDLYVRAKVISNKLKKNPYQKGDMEVAWTQPVVYTP